MNGFSKLAAVLSLAAIFSITALASQDITTINPDDVHPPYKNRYSHGKLVPPGAHWLYTAGQTGVTVDGDVPEGIEEQADWAMKNLFNVIHAAGMASEDVVKMTIYYLDPAHLSIIVAARNKYFGEGFSPASTAVGVPALARPNYLVEVEAVAAKLMGN